MKISVNWIRLMNANYGCSDSSELDNVDKLVEKIGLQLGAVEEVINIGERYQGIIVVKVVSAEKHPDADKLKVCLIDGKNTSKGTTLRNKDGLVQVVCGAPNVKAGQLVAWIPPGITVPSTFDKDPFVLEAREIRGQISNGMIASGKELAINDNHEGILVIEEPAEPGEAFAEVYRLDDHIIDIENKMFTHRPDCFGLLGVARELAGICNKPFKSPDWYREDASLPADGRKNVLKLSVKNEVPELVPRFCAVAVKDVKVGPSPVWLQSFLSRVGIRPINNIVDITNWFMYVTGQPLHAYDYDKIAGAGGEGRGVTLGIRLSKKGEKLRLLGGKEITLDQGAVVITDGQKPIGLGGIMGGADTEVDEKTKNIIFECANFDMNLTRKTAMAYGLFTDAATRFTKNQSPRQNRAVLAKTANDTLQLVGGRLASPLIDDKHFKENDMTVKTDSDFINSRLGTDLAAREILNLLSNVEFKVASAGNKITVTVPFWRTDIEIPEDIVEEVGRLYGYDKLPVELPRRDVAPAAKDPLLSFKTRLRGILRRAGANEALTYSFVHADLMKKTGQDPSEAFHIRNAVSPDLQYYRLSLTPSLLEKVHANIRGGFDEFALFEIGKAHGKTEVEDGLPKEFDRLSLVLAHKTQGKGAAFYWAKSYVDFLAKQLNLDLRYEPAEADKFKNHKLFQQMLAVYEPKRAALVFAGEKLAGAIGEFPASTRNSLKLPAYCAGAELFLSTLRSSAGIDYQPPNRFPELGQDFCLRSAANLSYEKLAEFMAKNLSHLSAKPGYHFKIEPLDIFQKKADKDHKQTTWRIILWHPERTLTTEETNKLLDEVAAKAKKELKAERI